MKKHVQPEDVASESKQAEVSPEESEEKTIPASTAQDEAKKADKPDWKPSHHLDRLCQAIEESDKKLMQKLEPQLAYLEELEKGQGEHLDLVQRVQADFDNYQKRVRREKEERLKYRHEDIVRDLLPALDNLGHSIALKCESEDAKCLLEGVELIHREILRILEKNGVVMIKAQQEEFDPAFHEAVGTVESTDQPVNMVAEEVKPGFMLHERVLRPSQVIVTVAPQKTESKPTE